MPFRGSEFLVFLVYLSLFCLHLFSLCLLVGGIFAHESHSAIHLREVFGGENEHQLALYGAVAVHVSHRFDILLFSVIEFLVEFNELYVELRDVAVEMSDVPSYGVDSTPFVSNLGIYHHQVLQSLLYVALVFAQFLLLRCNLLFYLCAFAFKSLDG